MTLRMLVGGATGSAGRKATRAVPGGPCMWLSFGTGSLGEEHGREVQAERLACAKHWRASAKPPGVQVSTAKSKASGGFRAGLLEPALACSWLHSLRASPDRTPGVRG